jgi:hypothetical protein
MSQPAADAARQTTALREMVSRAIDALASARARHPMPQRRASANGGACSKTEAGPPHPRVRS